MAAPIDIQLILCDAAVSDPSGKVHMLGAGWSVTGAPIAPHAVVVLMGIPWDRANQKIPLRLQLCDENGQPVQVTKPDGERTPVVHSGDLEIGQPPELAAETLIDAAFSVSIPPLQLGPGRYQWRVQVGEQLVSKLFTAQQGRDQYRSE
ncbi:hypothetical protein AB0K18_49970 [Nonomuraea sp. NPDC049421]|uniref:DUF6941 family protein n=1 Tax=Nonomuraea sp. NPDC049421 TaxID=3155275 RepID=UPI0034252B6B